MTNLTTRSEPQSAVPASTAMSPGKRLLWLGPTGVVVAVGLSVVEWLVVRAPGDNGSVAAASLALLMTAPVILARRWPIVAAAFVAGAAVLNGLLFGDLVRCAGAFPAVCYIAFAVGARARTGGRSWARSFAGLGLAVAALLAQYVWDPALNADSSFLWFGPGVALLAWTAGTGWSVLSERRRGQLAETAR
jgi:hypothetical protein